MMRCLYSCSTLFLSPYVSHTHHFFVHSPPMSKIDSHKELSMLKMEIHCRGEFRDSNIVNGLEMEKTIIHHNRNEEFEM